MKAWANHNSSWTYTLGAGWGVLLGMKIKPLMLLKQFFIIHASTAQENSNCSDLLGNFSYDQTMQKKNLADFRYILSAELSRSSFESNLFVHVKKEITASNIVCCFKHSSRMLWVS